MQELPFILCLDRGGLVGEDGPTHHGVLDISMFISMPNIVISAPRDGNELRDLFNLALNSKKGFVIRYPKGDCIDYDASMVPQKIDLGSWEILKEGERCAILAVGSMVDIALKNYDYISKKIGFSPTLINARFIKPIDKNILKKLFSKKEKIITLEEGSKIGGFGSFILNYANTSNYGGKVKILGIDDEFVDQGSRLELLDYCGLTSSDIIKEILND